MKQLTRAGIFLMLLTSLAVVARADGTSATATSSNDFKVILNDPSCPSDAFCVDIGYGGSTTVNYTVSNPLVINAPPQPIPQGQTAACGSTTDPSISCDVFAIPSGDPQTFLGVAFWGFSVSPDSPDLTVGVSGIQLLTLDLPAGYSCDPPSACPNGIITLTPEPSAAFLLMSGLLALAVFRKRFRAAVPAQAG